MAETAGKKSRNIGLGENYKWFYIGVIFAGTVGNSALGMKNIDANVRWGIIAVAIAFSIILPRIVRLSYAFGTTIVLVVVALGSSSTLASYNVNGSSEMRLFQSIISLSGLLSYTMLQLMFIGLVFNWIARGSRKLKGNKA